MKCGKPGQRGLPVFVNSLNAIQMFYASPVPVKSAHVSAEWQNIASLNWYTLTESRTLLYSASATALWRWSGVKMSTPLPVFTVHFTVFAWLPSRFNEQYLYLCFCLTICVWDQHGTDTQNNTYRSGHSYIETEWRVWAQGKEKT